MKYLYRLKIHDLGNWYTEQVNDPVELLPETSGIEYESMVQAVDSYNLSIIYFGQDLLRFLETLSELSVIRSGFYLLKFIWIQKRLKLDRKRIDIAQEPDSIPKSIKMLWHLALIKIGC